MPSFDVVSEINSHELTNSVDQANRTIDTRYDFKGVEAKFSYSDPVVNIEAESEMHVRQMVDLLLGAFTKRGVDVKCLDFSDTQISGKLYKKVVTVRQGLDKEQGKKLVKLIKDSKMKVQAAIQGEQVRVTGKKRDDLQEVIQMLRQSDFEMPLQFNNFRD